ncbi:site-specific integrase [Polaribacter sp.]|nr:site-specific integrase [Polaribacter sp.]
MKQLPTVFLAQKSHRKTIQLLLRFKYNDELIAIVRTLSGVKWSKSLNCWYVAYSKEQLQNVRLLFKNITIVDESQITKKYDFQRKPNQSQRNTLNAFYKFLQGKRYSNSTIRTYTFFVADFICFHESKTLAELNNRDVELFIECVFLQRNYSISSQRQFISALKLFIIFYPHTKIDELVLERPKQSRKLPNVLSQKEVLQIIKATKNLKHKAIITLIYSCGLRISELINLKLIHFNLERRQLFISNGKGRKDRYVSLAESFVPLLMDYYMAYKPKEYFVEGQLGNKYSPESVRQFLKKSCFSAGIKRKITPHTLRHSYATHLLENGVDIRYIQTFLGHAKPETTMIYTHVKRSDLMQISNPLDLALAKAKLPDNQNSNTLLSREI